MPYFIFFYKENNCSECESAINSIIKIADKKHRNNDFSFKFAAINAELDVNQFLLNVFNISKFPEIIFIGNSRYYQKYDGPLLGE